MSSSSSNSNAGAGKPEVRRRPSAAELMLKASQADSLAESFGKGEEDPAVVGRKRDRSRSRSRSAERPKDKPYRRDAAVAATDKLRAYSPDEVQDDAKDADYKSPREKERKEFKDSYQATKTQLANLKRELVKTVDAALEAEDARAEAKRGFQVICDDLLLGDVDLEQVTVASVRKLVTDAQVDEDQATTLLHYLARYVSKTYEILVQKNKKQAQEASIEALEKKVKDMEAGRHARSVAW